MLGEDSWGICVREAERALASVFTVRFDLACGSDSDVDSLCEGVKSSPSPPETKRGKEFERAVQDDDLIAEQALKGGCKRLLEPKQDSEFRSRLVRSEWRVANQIGHTNPSQGAKINPNLLLLCGRVREACSGVSQGMSDKIQHERVLLNLGLKLQQYQVNTQPSAVTSKIAESSCEPHPAAREMLP